MNVCVYVSQPIGPQPYKHPPKNSVVANPLRGLLKIDSCKTPRDTNCETENPYNFLRKEAKGNNTQFSWGGKGSVVAKKRKQARK